MVDDQPQAEKVFRQPHRGLSSYASAKLFNLVNISLTVVSELRRANNSMTLPMIP